MPIVLSLLLLLTTILSSTILSPIIIANSPLPFVIHHRPRPLSCKYRYGVVADAIIMLGGLAEALRAGGVEVGAKGGGYKDQAAIIDEDEFEDSEDDEKKVVDGAEIKKYLKLSRGSLEDINRMTEPILSKK